MSDFFRSAQLDEKTVNIGEIFVAVKPMKLIAVLGSCVAVCLWDRESNIGAMNHYLLPESGKSNLYDPMISYRYGNSSLPALIKKTISSSAIKDRFVAKIFGGGMNSSLVFLSGKMVAESNIDVAERVLKDACIKIIERNVGGTEGRKIVFDTKTGEVSVETIHIKMIQAK